MEKEKHKDRHRAGLYISMDCFRSILGQGCGCPNYACPVNKMKRSRSFGAMRNSLSSLNPEMTCQALHFLTWNNQERPKAQLDFSVLLYIY